MLAFAGAFLEQGGAMGRRGGQFLFWVLVVVGVLLGAGLSGRFVDASTDHLQRGQSAASAWLGVLGGALILVAVAAAAWLLRLLLHRRYQHGPLGGVEPPASLRDPVHGRRVLFWVLALAAVVTATASLAGISNAAIQYLPSGQSRAAALLAPLAGLVVSAALIWGARLTARQLRGRHGTGTVEISDRSRRRRSGTSRDTRGPLGFLLVLLAGLMVWCVLAASVSLRDYHRSVAVQYHGIAVTGVVTGLVPVSHLQRYGSYDTYDLDVSFTPAIYGQQKTTVNTLEQDPAQHVGDSTPIRVDPSQPDYAELPGQPTATPGDFTFPAVAFVFLAALAVVSARTLVRKRPAPGGPGLQES